jgi:glycosyltransferase involved in cell wall biosynthesis
MPMVSFVVPVRNEEQHIRACLQSLVDQDYPPGEIEIIVVDGQSSDATPAILEEMRQQSPQIRCLENPAGVVPSAMNIGIRASRGDVIIRADGHNIYPRNYATDSVRILAETGADNVGGPWVTVCASEALGGRLVGAILTSPFGVGNSCFRTGGADGYVDTVPFGAFRRSVFDRVGYYDENLVRNQDNELNARIRAAGGKIYLSSALTTFYHPVSTFRELLRYAFRTSRWHLYTISRNTGALGLRHLAPAAFVLAALGLGVASVFSSAALTALIALALFYLTIGEYFALRGVKSLKFPEKLALPFAVFCFHVAYGCGVLAGAEYLLFEPSKAPIRPGKQIQQTPGFDKR